MSDVLAAPAISCLPLSVKEMVLGRGIQIPLPKPPLNQGQYDLAGDLFWMLYAGYTPLPSPPPERQATAALLRWLTEDPQWSVERTMWSTPVSAHAASALWAALLSDPVVSRALDLQEESGEGGEGGEHGEGLSPLGSPSRAGETAQPSSRGGGSAQGQVMAALQRWTETPKGQALRRQAIQAAEQTVRDILDSLMGWGMEPGTLARVDHQEAMSLLKRMNSPRLREIARMAGRLRGIASQASRERVPRGHVPAEVVTTGDVLRLLPREAALLSRRLPPALRAYQLSRLDAGALLGLRFSRPAREAGPFFAAVDISGSMLGQRFITAKAIALGLALLAQDEGREFCLAAFSSDHDPLVVVSSEDAAQNPQALLDWAEVARWGGTSFDLPLLAAMEWVGERTDADVLFISDGEARPSPEVVERWIAFREQVGARLLYVPVAKGYGGMEKIADVVFPADELLPSAGETIARNIGQVWRCGVFFEE